MRSCAPVCWLPFRRLSKYSGSYWSVAGCRRSYQSSEALYVLLNAACTDVFRIARYFAQVLRAALVLSSKEKKMAAVLQPPAPALDSDDPDAPMAGGAEAPPSLLADIKGLYRLPSGELQQSLFIRR